MNQELLNLYPKGLWDIFGHICDAPTLPSMKPPW